jgi:hypothetical protein
MDQLLMRQEAADRLGVHFAKLERLRRAGLLPEAVRVGRLYVFPISKIDAIRERLIAQGHLQAEVANAH